MNSVRVRILVAVTDDGAYVAEGYSDTKPRRLVRQMAENIHNHMTPPIDFYWIEADVPIPQPLHPRTLSRLFVRLKGASRPKRRPVMTRKTKGKQR